MAFAHLRWVVAGIIGLTGYLTCSLASPVATAKQPPPKVMLWSWFADDDFRPLADRDIGVAYLALSLRLEGQSQITPSPRYVPVRIPPKMYRMAVIRLDNSFEGAAKPAYSPRQRELAARMIGEIVELAHPQAVQIDFDAPQSARPFYRQLLSDVRGRIGPDVFLSMTALVSWCGAAQSWLSGLPVDEIVPMAFHMGQATPATITMLRRGGRFPFAGCQGSIGVAAFEDYSVPAGSEYLPVVRPRSGQRAYFFPMSQRWSSELVSAAQKAFLP